MMLLAKVLNASVGSVEVLVVTGAVVLLGTPEERAKVVVGYGTKGFKKSELTYKGGDCLFGSALTLVGARTRVASCIDVVILL